MTAKRVIQASAINAAAKNGDIEIDFFLKSFPLLLTCHALTLSSGVMLLAGIPRTWQAFWRIFRRRHQCTRKNALGGRALKPKRC